MIGLHSVMLSPDSVNRVTPPTTMIPRTRTDESISHRPIAGEGKIGKFSAAAWVPVVGELEREDLKRGRLQWIPREAVVDRRGFATVVRWNDLGSQGAEERHLDHGAAAPNERLASGLLKENPTSAAFRRSEVLNAPSSMLHGQ